MAHRPKTAACHLGMHRPLIALLVAVTGMVAAPCTALAQQPENPCGELANAFGPFEYRPDHYKPAPGDQTSHAFKLQLVEKAHFTAPVQRLTAGNTAARPGGDLDYTLRAFPNNHRALATVLNASKRYADASQIDLPRPFECYFERALRFAPDDTVARLLYASFLIQQKRVDDARKQIDYSATLAGDNAFTHLNVGMSYFDAGDYDNALKQAHIAAQLGYTRPDLKQRLSAIGRWSEPAPLPAADAASAPASAP